MMVWTALTFVLGLSLRLLAIRYKWECRGSSSTMRSGDEDVFPGCCAAAASA
jgi:hypothetical protein